MTIKLSTYTNKHIIVLNRIIGIFYTSTVVSLRRYSLSMEEIRWKYRFKNFENAYNLLREAIYQETLNSLELEGIMQRFEYTWELAWKVLKDRLEFDGLTITHISPKNVIRLAYTNKYIADGDGWMAMLESRNLLAHTYSEENFNKILAELRSKYFNLLDDFYMDFKKSSLE